MEEAIEIVGRPPTWARPPSGVLRLAWRPGRYRAVALRSPMSTGGAAMDVILTAREDGPARLTWPDRDIAYLAFVAGPAD